MALPRELGQHYRAAQRGPRYSRSRYVARVFSFLFCAAMRALGAEGASDGPGVVSCSTGSQVVAALADPAVSVAILMNSVGLVEEDFAPYALPIRRTGNFTVLGAHEPRALWPRLDMAYLQNKVWLAPGVWWILERLVLYRPREPPLFLASGMDILVDDTGRDPTLGPGAGAGPGGEPATAVLIRHAVLIQRSCLPPDLGDVSADSLPRPAITGAGLRQRFTSTRTGPEPGCIDGEGAPPALKCYPGQGEYVDQSSYGFGLDEYVRTERLGYAMWVFNVTYMCEVLMSMECIGGLGLFGCYYSLLPHLGPGGVVISPPTNQTAAGPLAKGTGNGSSSGDGGGGGGGDGRKLLAPVLGGVLGGVAALALVSAVVWLAVRRRRRRQLSGTAAGGGDLEKGGAVPQSPLASGCGVGGGGGSSGSAAPAVLALSAVGKDVGGVAKIRMDLGAGVGEGEGGGGGLKEGPASGKGVVLGEWTHDSAAPDSAAPESADPLEASLVPVTPLAPLHPDIPLNVKARKGSKQAAASSPHAPQPPQDASAPAAGRSAAHQVTLLPVTIGKGAYGRVVEGLYGGQRVAVKVIDTGLMAVALLEEARAAEGASGSTGTGSGTSGSLGAVVGLGGGDGGVGPERAVRALTATLAQEVEVLARCQHPNVVRLLAANLRPPWPLLVMELMDTSLDRLMAATPGRTMHLAKVLHIGIQVARALSYLHPTVIHRDIKPANVLISNPHSDTPTAKLADFGLSRLRSSVLVTQHPEVGTGPYMAPECFDVYNTTITAKADMYSLGVLLWEMGSGEVPWAGLPVVAIARAVALEDRRPPLQPLLSRGYPPKLVRLVAGCWDPDPLRRPAAPEAHKQLLLAVQEAGLGVGGGQGQEAGIGAAVGQEPGHEAGAGAGGGQEQEAGAAAGGKLGQV